MYNWSGHWLAAGVALESPVSVPRLLGRFRSLLRCWSSADPKIIAETYLLGKYSCVQGVGLALHSCGLLKGNLHVLLQLKKSSKKISIKHQGMRGMVHLFYLLLLCGWGCAFNRNSSEPGIARGLSCSAACHSRAAGTLLSVLPSLKWGTGFRETPSTCGRMLQRCGHVGGLGDVFGE